MLGGPRPSAGTQWASDHRGRHNPLPWRHLPRYARKVYRPQVKALPGVSTVPGLVLGLGMAAVAATPGSDSLGPYGPGDVPDSYVVVRGGQGDVLPAGRTFSGAAGSTVEEAASSVPHGTIRTSTGGDIGASGGTVEVAPEPTRPGAINLRHVNVTEGSNPTTFSGPIKNPIPSGERAQ